MKIRHATPEDAETCISILVALPEYFTTDTHAELRRALTIERGWVAEEDGMVVGFALVAHRFPRASEITFAAVTPGRRGQGVGTAIVQHLLAALAPDGVAIVEVKTLDATAGYEPYVATRAFWERRGFVQIDRIDPLPGWQPGNPAAIYAAAVNRTC